MQNGGGAKQAQKIRALPQTPYVDDRISADVCRVNGCHWMKMVTKKQGHLFFSDGPVRLAGHPGRFPFSISTMRSSSKSMRDCTTVLPCASN